MTRLESLDALSTLLRTRAPRGPAGPPSTTLPTGKRMGGIRLAWLDGRGRLIAAMVTCPARRQCIVEWASVKTMDLDRASRSAFLAAAVVAFAREVEAEMESMDWSDEDQEIAFAIGKETIRG